MKRTMLYLLVFGLSVSFVATSCKKGDAGPQGEQGDKGDKGDKGDVGSPNVIYSSWLSVTFQSSGQGYGVGTIDAPKITADVLNKGEIKVYINLSTAAAPAIYVLPYSEPATDTDDALYLQAQIELGKIYMFSNYNMSTGVNTNNQTVSQYRYVIIPGGVSARAVTVNWADYNEVKKYLGIKD